MQLFVRSQLAVGTAAVMGAALLAPLPAQSMPSLRPASVEVGLAAVVDPWIEIAGTLKLLDKFLFDPSGPVTVSPAAGSELSAWGIFPQIAKDGLPILTALGDNAIGYLVETARGAVKVVDQLASGHFGAAGVTATRTLTYAPAAVLNHLYFLAKATPEIIGYFTKPLAAQLKAIQNIVLITTVGIGIGLSSHNPSFAWNTAAQGLLGPYGIPGVLLSLTVGAGLPSSGPVQIPSLRTEIATAIGRVDYILRGLSPVPPPAASAPTASRVRTATGVTGSARDISSRHPSAASRVAPKRPTSARAGSARNRGH